MNHHTWWFLRPKHTVTSATLWLWGPAGRKKKPWDLCIKIPKPLKRIISESALFMVHIDLYTSFPERHTLTPAVFKISTFQRRSSGFIFHSGFQLQTSDMCILRARCDGSSNSVPSSLLISSSNTSRIVGSSGEMNQQMGACSLSLFPLFSFH